MAVRQLPETCRILAGPLGENHNQSGYVHYGSEAEADTAAARIVEGWPGASLKLQRLPGPCLVAERSHGDLLTDVVGMPVHASSPREFTAADGEAARRSAEKNLCIREPGVVLCPGDWYAEAGDDVRQAAQEER